MACSYMFIYVSYLGSKKKLAGHVMTEIEHVINKIVTKSPNRKIVFGELFSGSGIVSYNLQHAGIKNLKKIVTNDYLEFNQVMNYANLYKYTTRDIEIINDKIDSLNDHTFTRPDIYSSFVYDNYASKYFSNENAEKIDVIRGKLEHMKVKPHIFMYLLATLIQSVDKVSNVAAVYDAYLKKLKPDALKPLILKQKIEEMTEESNILCNVECLNKNVTDLYSYKFDIVYIDPPYTSGNYGNHYHILETICKYDNPTISGITGRRSSYEKSDFSLKSKAKDAFIRLFQNIKANYIIVSYSNEGIVNIDDLLSICNLFGKCTFKKIPIYRRFTPHDNTKTQKELFEYIITVST
jgi:adenine-specific DNA-methyltransferase